MVVCHGTKIVQSIPHDTLRCRRSQGRLGTYMVAMRVHGNALKLVQHSLPKLPLVVMRTSDNLDTAFSSKDGFDWVEPSCSATNH